jgi:uncharacterized ion transporter superfamily protein YfcC
MTTISPNMTTINPNVTMEPMNMTTSEVISTMSTPNTKPTTLKPTTTTATSKFNGVSFGEGIALGMATTIVIFAVVYFLKYRKRSIEYQTM